MTLKPLLTLLLLLLSFRFVSARENYIVKNVEITGNQTIDAGDLTEYMSTRSVGFFTKLFTSKTDFYYSRELASADAERLQRYYQQHGFLNAEVTFTTFEVDDEKRTIAVRFDIDENQPVLVDSIRFHRQADTLGVLGDSLVREIRESIKLKKGMRFRDELARSDKEMIRNVFIRHGFPYLSVQSNLSVDTTSHRVRVTWRLAPGRRARFGEISIQGNQKLSDKSIRNQLTFEPGVWFNPEKINSSQQRLYDLGVYNVVTVRVDLSKPRPKVPIHIELQPSPRFTTKLGAGYGREEEFRTFVDFRFLNFTGGARRLHVYFRHSALEPYNANARFVQPAFLTPTTSLSLNPFILRQTEPAFTVNRAGGNLILQHQFGRNYVVGSVYAYENVQLDEQSVSDRNIEGLVKLYNKSSVSLNLSHNTTDQIMSPTKGSLKSVLLKYSGLWGSNYRYTKAVFELRKYQRIGPPVLALRLQVGNILSHDQPKYIPVEERFYTGGSQSVRGWQRFQLGPKDEDGVPSGGRGMLVGNVELRTLIFKSFAVTTFLDMGNVWQDQYNLRLGDLRYAAGIGLRYTTPIGPIRIDVAHPVWDAADQLQIHFSVGEAF